MNKNIIMTYNGMNQDISQSKFSNQFYFEGKNIRILATDSQSSTSITNDKGNELVLTIPTPVIDYNLKQITYNDSILNYTTNDLNNLSPNQSGVQILLEHSICKDTIVLFTTDNNGFDCIWNLDKEFNITLLYLRNLGFSTNNPIQAISNYENNLIEKVYWVDGKNQMRFLNIKQSVANGDDEELIDIETSLINVVGDFKFTQPRITTKEQGGTHTAGMIQYAYILYKVNGSTTKLSPLSELISLDNGPNGGGKVNEIVSFYPVVNIPILDQDYTNIKLYSIKYTSYNELPEIKLILDKNIQNETEVTYYDTGSFINNVSLDEFAFLGSNTIYIPKHINTKFNRLFSANYKEKNFNIDIDTRTYSFAENETEVYLHNTLTHNNVTDDIIGDNNFLVNSTTINNVPLKHNCLNKDFDTFKHQINSSKLGGTGRYLSWELNRSQIGVGANNISLVQSKGKFFKDREIYRLGIQFYNKKAQISLPKWITDFKVNVLEDKSNLNGYFANLKVKFNSDFYVWLNTSSNFLDEDGNYDDELKPVGFKLLRAERTLNDRSVVCQGMLNSSYVIRNTSQMGNINFIPENDSNTRRIYNNHPKLPSFVRPFDGSVAPLKGMFNYARVDDNDTPHPSQGGGTATPTGSTFYGTYRNNGRAEMFGAASSSDWRSMVYQFNQLFQLYSPDIIFNSVQKLENTDLNVLGILLNSYNAFWGKLINSNTQEVSNEGKIRGAITPYTNNFNTTYLLPDGTPYDPLVNPPTPPTNAEYQAHLTYLISEHDTIYGTFASEVPLYLPTYEEYSQSIIGTGEGLEGEGLEETLGSIKTFNSWGIIGPQGNGRNFRAASFQPQYQYYREFNGQFKCSQNETKYDIYGNPLLVDLAAGRTIYNQDNDLVFYNTYQIMNTDTGAKSDNSPNWRVKEVNSWGSRCAILSLGNNNINTIDRISLDDIFKDITGLTFNPLTTILDNNDGNSVLISELNLNKSSIYLGLLYGGNDYESRKRTNYIEIGEYQNFIFNIDNELEYFCKNPGDTFVSDFKFTKIVKTNTETYDLQIPQYTEIVNIRTESTIDLKNRSDYSVEDWDSRFQPKYEEYQNYNKVYSQEPNLFIRKDVDYNFKAVSQFENGIIASQVKIPGEFIDSWLSYQPNEVMYLDGKHGSINCLHSFKDEIYTLQDRAIATISINPRVQVQGNDGVEIQLGTGQVLDRYQYLSTMSGTLNKWSVVNSPNAFYYYDTLNKTLNMFVNELSDVKGLHTFFMNNTSKDLEFNNPLLNKGIVATYDYLNNELIFTFLQENNNFTLVYNELTQTFTSFYDFVPNHYISVGDLLLSVNSQNNLNNQIYQHGVGEYNKYYNRYYDSSVTLNLNPEPHFDCVFDNINYKSEVYINNIDQPDMTLTNIQAYNDYQNTSLVPLINGRNGNLRRRFRDWNAEIPRDGRNRIRGPWIKLKVQFNNQSNYKLILHDMIISYTV